VDIIGACAGSGGGGPRGSQCRAGPV